MDRIDVMRLFTRVADGGSFSKAARTAGISQPTVSKLIAALEKRLGAQLLRRTSRGLTLTAAGQDYYEASLRVVEAMEDAESRIGKGEIAPSGLVRVAISAGFGRMYIIPRLPEFFAAYPDVEVEFDISQRHVNLVEEGLDLAIRLGHLTDSSLLARRIGSQGMTTVASPAYIARHGAPLTPDDLQGHACISFVYRDAPRPWAFKGAAGKGAAGPIEVHPTGPMRCNDAENIREAVVQGLGIGHNANWLYARDIDDGALVPLLKDYAPDLSPINAVWPGSRRLPSKTRVFVDFLADVFNDSPVLKNR